MSTPAKAIEQRTFKYVFTGGSGTGKTTLINYLKTQKHDVLEEAWTAECERTHPSKDESWSLKFREHLMKIQNEQEQKLTAPRTFLDRCTQCIVGITEMQRETLSKDTLALARTDYDLVFFLEMVPKDMFADVHFCDYEKSEQMQTALKRFYFQAGYTIVTIPFNSVKKRAQMIIDEVEQFEADCKAKD